MILPSLAAALFAVALSPLAHAEAPLDAAPAAAPAPTYSEVSPLISAACGECHQNGGHKGHIYLDKESDLADELDTIIDALERGRMPPGDDAWATSTDGQRVLAYLKAKQATLPPPSPGTGGEDDDRCRKKHKHKHEHEGREHEHEGHKHKHEGHSDDDDDLTASVDLYDHHHHGCGDDD